MVRFFLEQDRLPDMHDFLKAVLIKKFINSTLIDIRYNMRACLLQYVMMFTALDVIRL